ncbi:methyltransferase domain-containing protein [Spiribacter sp. C176]|uniref:Protein-L-isoaspartate O-methyltransferase n=1 Tax=Spiribacter salilacus TaxID=2664894 RepID=A0A6N7QPA2_9GAMM|nr:protein-L-isoaspartate O-methyltransferase [Spiribacter salilacus]MRH78246.1 methyltransferase domain-containing protein [Spiribacter salilacus]
MTKLDSQMARGNMIGHQIRAWEVLNDRILETLNMIPRHQFVPSAFVDIAYSDMQIPLGHGQVMLEPKIQGRLLQATNPMPKDRVLEIGTGSGFLTACLSSLCAHVTTVELLPEFHVAAKDNLTTQGITNYAAELGDAASGWLDGEVYDVIVVTASMPVLNQQFHRQLSQGGRLFVITGQPPIMEALLITRIDEDQWSTESLFDGYAPPLIGAETSHAFTL